MTLTRVSSQHAYWDSTQVNEGYPTVTVPEPPLPLTGCHEYQYRQQQTVDSKGCLSLKSVPICSPLIVPLIRFSFINLFYACLLLSNSFRSVFPPPHSPIYSNAFKVSSPLFRIATDDDSCIAVETFGSNLLLASEVKWQLCMKHSPVVQGKTYTCIP